MSRHAITVCLATLLLPATSSADTVADWRFEPGAFLTDSAGSAPLTQTGAVEQVVYPSNDRGQHFPAGHNGGADFNTIGENLGATITPLTGDFTVEAFINHDSNAQLNELGFHWGALIAGAFAGSNVNSSAWNFEIRLDQNFSTVPGELLLSVSGPSGFDVIGSDLVIESNKDYYVAAAVDADSDGSITFYAQNLSDRGPLQSTRFAINRPVLNSFDTVWIGETPDGFNFLFDGVIDEIRLSNTTLTPAQLLVSAVPLPSGVWMLAPALAGLSGLRRRKSSGWRGAANITRR